MQAPIYILSQLGIMLSALHVLEPQCRLLIYNKIVLLMMKAWNFVHAMVKFFGYKVIPDLIFGNIYIHF